MQTFLPFPDIETSLRVLDYRRLGKQRIEARQILDVLVNPSSPSRRWINHPAVHMWRGHETGLAVYYNACCMEWTRRGYINRMPLITAVHGQRISTYVHVQWPSWFGNAAFHRSHQSNLIRKYPEHYRLHFPGVPANLPYIWPKP